MNQFLKKISNQYILLLIVFTCFAIGYREVIFYKKMVFTGDAEMWYALYHYFTEAIYNNSLALWNPYMNGGEPFFQTWGMWRLIDPVNLFPIFIGKIFNINIYELFHIHFFIKILVAILGGYFLLKHIFQLKKSVHLYVLIIILLLFTNISLSELMYDGHYVTFCWFPYILLFFIRFIEHFKIIDFLWFIYFSAIHIGAATYTSIYGVFLILAFILTSIILTPSILKSLFQFIIKNRISVIISATMLMVLILPAILTAIYVTDLYPVGRTWDKRELFEQTDKGIFELKRDEILERNSGGSATISDVLLNVRTFTIGSLFPGKNNHIIITYLGYTLVIIAIFGALFSRNRWKIHFGILFILSMIIVAGHNTPLYGYLSSIFFPLEFIRNTIYSYPFVQFIYFYFVGIGLIQLVNLFPKFEIGFNYILIMAIFFILYFTVQDQHFTEHLEPVTKMSPDFEHTAQPYQFIEERYFAMPRPAWYLLEPILYKNDVALSMLGRQPENMSEFQLPYYQEWNKWWKMLEKTNNKHGAVIALRTFFWTKYYHNIYLLGERDAGRFNALMGVKKDKLFFSNHVLLLDDKETKEMVLSMNGTQLNDVLDNTIIIHSPPPEDQLNTLNQLQLADKIFIFPKPEYDPESSPFSYQLLDYTPNYISLTVEAKSHGLLLYRDGYDKAWKASVNDASTPVYRANIGFKAIYLPKGTHQVTFSYQPSGFIIAVIIFMLLSLLIPVLLVIFQYKFSQLSSSLYATALP